MRVLTFVDAPLLRQIATGLIGSEVKITEKESSSIGINFKILLSRSVGDEKTRTTKTSDLLPEVLCEAVHDMTRILISNFEEVRGRFVCGTEGAFMPGTPVLFSKCLILRGERNRAAQLSGEACVEFRAKAGDYGVNFYSARDSEREIEGLVDQPVEVLGVLRYTPPYSTAGAYNLNLGLRIAAIWLA